MNIAVIIVTVLILVFVLYVVKSVKKFKSQSQVAESDKIIHLDEKNFKTVTEGRISLVDFWAEWCMPCKMMAPILNEVAGEVNNDVKICKVNVESAQPLANRFSVRSIPTLVLLKDGKEINRFVGIKTKEFLLKQISLVNN